MCKFTHHTYSPYVPVCTYREGPNFKINYRGVAYLVFLIKVFYRGHVPAFATGGYRVSDRIYVLFISNRRTRSGQRALGYRIHALFISNRCTRSGQRLLGYWDHALFILTVSQIGTVRAWFTNRYSRLSDKRRATYLPGSCTLKVC